jgi:hypothetical protein
MPMANSFMQLRGMLASRRFISVHSDVGIKKSNNVKPRELKFGQRKEPVVGAKALRKTVVYTYVNQLTTASYLSFTDARLELIDIGRVDPMHEFSLLMRRVKKALRPHSSFPYLAVPEYSKEGRLHIHLMLPAGFEFELVQNKWEINGIAESCTVKPGVGLAKMGFYLAKDFDKPVGQRPFERRSIPALGFKPQPINYGFLTRAQALEVAQMHADEAGVVIEEFYSKKPWLRGGFKWFEHSEFEEGVLPPWAS